MSAIWIVAAHGLVPIPTQIDDEGNVCMAIGKAPGEMRNAAGIQDQDEVAFGVSGPVLVEIRRLSGMSLNDALERYLIEAEVDEAVDRVAWEATAATAVLSTAATS